MKSKYGVAARRRLPPGLPMLGVLLVGLLVVAPAALAEQTAARTLLLVRHGHYLPDPAADPELGPGISALGVAQARGAGDRLRGWPEELRGLYVSPLQRARDTAAVVAESLDKRSFQVVDDLAECTPPTRRKAITAESSEQSLEDCKKQLDRLFAAHFQPAKGQPQTDLLVCHGNVIRYLITRAMGVDSEAWLEMSVGHTSISKIRVEADGSFKVISVGDVGHLPPSLLTGASGDPERSLAVPKLSR